MEIKSSELENKNNASNHHGVCPSKKKIFVISKVKKVRNWTDEEDDILMETAEKYDFKNWNNIASKLPGRTAIQCSARYKRIKPGIVKGSWTEKEDSLLLDLLKKFGKNWSLISKYMTSRSGKQIRDRFLNSLDPGLSRDKFTSEEDKQIIKLYKDIGSQWSKIALALPGRTGDMIKNRFYSSLRKQIHSDDYREGLKKKKLLLGGKLLNHPNSKIIFNYLENFEKSKFLAKKRIRMINKKEQPKQVEKLDTMSNKKLLKKKPIFASIHEPQSGSENLKISSINVHPEKNLNQKNRINSNSSSDTNLKKSDFYLLEDVKKSYIDFKINNKNSNNLFEQNNHILLNNSRMSNDSQNHIRSQTNDNLYNVNPMIPNLSNVNITALNQVIQQNILQNYLLLNHENSLLNFNAVDVQMSQLLSLLIQKNLNSTVSSRSELEAQLNLMRQMLNFTYLKLDICKNNNMNPNFNSETNSKPIKNANETISYTSNSFASNLMKNEK